MVKDRMIEIGQALAATVANQSDLVPSMARPAVPFTHRTINLTASGLLMEECMTISVPAWAYAPSSANRTNGGWTYVCGTQCLQDEGR
jgi:hypothetical protein